MAKQHSELLVQALKNVYKIAKDGIVHSHDISRRDKNVLNKSGWLINIIRGWYLLSQPHAADGKSTVWYASYWNFIRHYLHDRFDNDYCLSAIDSIRLQLGTTTTPKQLIVMTTKGGSSIVNLPFDASLLSYQDPKNFPDITTTYNDINVIPLAIAITRLPVKYFLDEPQQLEIALKIVDKDQLLRELLKVNNIAAAERILGAYEHMGETSLAQQLKQLFTTAGYSLKAKSPFDKTELTLDSNYRTKSPYCASIKSIWQHYRNDIIKIFPVEPGLPTAKKHFLRQVDLKYVQDSYHSLSIEGYQVTEALIKKITHNQWKLNINEADEQQRNALAARGYYLAFQAVKHSIEKILQKNRPGTVFQSDISTWHQQLFYPAVQAGLISIEQLAGYRNDQVYIRGSRHTPFPKYALMDAMDTLFQCLTDEPSAAVRAVLGHFVFVFIHPYMDGNGRLGRFLMNTQLASGGFPWTIIHVENRVQYFSALEKASVLQNIKPLAQFILRQMKLD